MDSATGRSPVGAAYGSPVGSAARASGGSGAIPTELVAMFDAARIAGDTEAMAEAALAMPTRQRFGVHPGQIPALLHEAYTVTETPSTRCRLAAALARSWVYGGDAVRAARFADDAQRLAAEVATPETTADALDAALVAHWGPDDFTERVSLAARLDEVAAHLRDPEPRISAHLWRLTTAWECLDIVAVQRQLRALDVVAEESGSARAAFFAVSRRAMHAIAIGDARTADQLIARTRDLGAEVAEPDVDAVLHELQSMHALLVGDHVVLANEAEAHAVFGAAEGIPSVTAVGAILWLAAGQPDRAGQLASQLMAGGVDGIARDVDFLLTVTCILGVTAALEVTDIVTEAAAALRPYAGRGVLNAGAVTFHGVVDDYLYRAGQVLGVADAERWRHAATSAYLRIGAIWWERSLNGARSSTSMPPRSMPSRSMSFRRDDSGRWSIGALEEEFVLPDLKGLHYLRHLLDRPGVDVAALALSDAVAGHPGASLDESDLGEILDAAALSAYRRRLRDLDDQLDATDLGGDQAVAVLLSEEREAILAQLRSAAGLGGRTRRSGASAERARVAVRKAIAHAIAQIDEHDHGVARLLNGSVRTGASCRYDPDPNQPLIWKTD